jgi:hypothetical protein
MTVINKMKSLAARATMDSRDVRALLEKDHDEAKQLAKQMCAATRAPQRKALLAKLKPALTAHSRAEERAVYQPMIKVKGSTDSHELAQEGFVEHGLVDELLTALASTNAAGDAWKAKAKVLKELLEHHIEEEQTDTFAELGEHFSEGQLAVMGAHFLREKGKLLLPSSRATKRATPRKAAPRRARGRALAARKRSVG